MKINLQVVFRKHLPIALFFLWLVFTVTSYVKSSGTGFLSLETGYDSKNLSGNINDNLTQGSLIQGQFVSDQANLGTIAVRFKTFNRINNDWLTFRLKEASQPSWYYQASYKTDQFQPNELFPFGFPPLRDSNGKKFIFEIESLGGTPTNSVAINLTPPAYVAKYNFSRRELLTHPFILAKFILGKTAIMFHDPKFQKNWFLFIAAMAIYFTALFLKKSYFATLILLTLTTFATIIYDLSFPWIVVIVVNILWLATFLKFKKTSSSIALVSLLFLFLAIVFTLAGQPKMVEKIANWIYYLLLLAFLRVSINVNANLSNTIKKIRKNLSDIVLKAKTSRYPQIIIFLGLPTLVLKEFNNLVSYYRPIPEFISKTISPSSILPVLLFIIFTVITLKFFKKKFLLLLLFLIFLVKLPFIFHGNWDNTMFVPYMTDETVFLSSISSFFVTGNFGLNNLLVFGYPPFLFNFLFSYHYLFFSLLKFFHFSLSIITIFKLVYYQSRLFVLVTTILGSYYFVKIFKEIIPSRFYQTLLLILINFNSLFFLYSTFMKTDDLVWALGAIAFYKGLVYWKNPSRPNYFKFGLFSLVPALVNYYGYFYLIFFAALSLLPFLKPQKSKLLISLKTKLIFTFLALPLIWLISNFELLGRIFAVIDYFLKFAASKNYLFVPFFENINHYSSFQYYLDYLRFFLGPLVFIVCGLILFIKNTNPFYKILTFSISVFALQISLSSYRTDRLFIPIYIFALTLIIYFFSQLDQLIHRYKFKVIVAAVFILAISPVLVTSYHLLTTLPGEDTRYTLYRRLQRELPPSSSITFLHNSIFGAYATADYLKLNNVKNFEIRVLDLTVADDRDQLEDSGGYFVISAFDLDILNQFKNTNYYQPTYEAVTKLIANSTSLLLVDKINYFSQPLGPLKLFPNSLYGIRNPPLYLYKTN